MAKEVRTLIKIWHSYHHEWVWSSCKEIIHTVTLTRRLMKSATITVLEKIWNQLIRNHYVWNCTILTLNHIVTADFDFKSKFGWLWRIKYCKNNDQFIFWQTWQNCIKPAVQSLSDMTTAESLTVSYIWKVADSESKPVNASEDWLAIKRVSWQ